MAGNSFNLNQAITALRELREDSTIPKSLQGKVANIIKVLEQGDSISVSRALHELEEMTGDNNMQSYTRTQLFNIVSLLEVV